jgi:predicted O-methyltransferase YrrM
VRAHRAAALAALAVAACQREAAPPAPAAAPTAAAASAPATAGPAPSALYAKDYEFTEDWFSAHTALWSRVLAPFRGKPGVHYLEVGLFEGRSALWMLEQVLTDPSARLTGVDLFPDPVVKERWLANLRKSGHADRATTITGYSQVELRKLPLDTYDIIYIDGSHRAADVMADAVLAWGLLKEGGVMIFDDYAARGPMSWTEAPWPPEHTPRLAVDAFLTAHSGSLELLHKQYQAIVRRTADACGPGGDACTPLGPYRYWWQRHALTRADGADVPLSPEERALVERVAGTKAAGEVTVKVPADLQSDPALAALMRRLDLRL